ncbi:MAG: dockerin type I domain-containing protein [Prevotellaceae bacterium]|nr:dockerin type I domain-containing protein [Prevotellaceae bacterium]
MKKIFTSFVALMAVVAVNAQTEKYVAITADKTMATEFASVIDESSIATNVVDGSSTVNFSTASMSCVAVGSANPNDVETDETSEFPGWTAGYKDVKWEAKNQGDISFSYINGTGNPAVVMGYARKYSENQGTYFFTPDWTYYMSDGSNGLPQMGLYYKFAPKVDGYLSIQIWANKGNRRTFFVDDKTMKAMPYEVEGYINGQNEKVWDAEKGDSVSVKKWLTNDDIQALHDAAGKTEPEDAYIIGAGNQPFWGNLNVMVEAGKTYWLFQHSSQVGFQGYEFTPQAMPGAPEEYVAITADKTMATEFASIIDENSVATNVIDGTSVVLFNTANMDCMGVSSANPNDVETDETSEFAGWTAGYKDVKWEAKNQGDISFSYINGTGNPAVVMGYARKYSENQGTYFFTPDWTYYMSDGSNGLPQMGLYYKFAPKVDGYLSIQIWANKGNRRTFFVDDKTMKAMPYEVEGYINGQNEKVWDAEKGDSVSVKKWLTNEDIQALHDAAGKTDPEDAYIIGAGNQPFWGNLNVKVEGGKVYWLFQHSSQVGFQGYRFLTTGSPVGLKGDANDDTVVDVADITTIAAYILGNSVPVFNADNADANNDGSIDVSDITTVAGMILGN